MKSFRDWLDEGNMSSNSVSGGGVDGIGDNIIIGGQVTKASGDDNNNYKVSDVRRANRRTAILAKLGMKLADQNANLYDQPDPYDGTGYDPAKQATV